MGKGSSRYIKAVEIHLVEKCRKCDIMFNYGETIYSKNKGRSGNTKGYYHKRCWEALFI